MNVHFFIGASFPFGMAGTKRVCCYAKGLQACGDKVFVHVCHRTYMKGKTDNLPAVGEYEGIKYDYPAGKFKSENKLKRGLDYYLLDSLKVFLYALRNVRKGDIMYVYLYPLFTQMLLLLASSFKNAKIIKETCEHPSALGKVDSRWHKFCKWFEYHHVMPHYDGFIPISIELAKFVEKYKSKNAQYIVVPILVEETIFDIDFSKMSSPYDVPYVIHTGTMLEQKDSISKIIEAFANYRKKYKSKLKLVFTGPHANAKCSYIPMMKELGVYDDIELLGMVSVEQVAILQHFASLTIIYKSDNLQTRNCFPTKLGEMLMSGIPVITTTVGDANMYLKNGESAFIFSPDDEHSLILYMHDLLVDKTKSIMMGNKGKEIALKYFNPYFQGRRIHDFLNQFGI